jgi:methyl-accepting chemotaxis protein
MSRLGIRALLLTLVAVPSAVAATLSFERAYERSTAADQAQTLSRMARLAVVIGDLLHETQKERGSSSVFLSSSGTKFKDEMNAQRRLTDQGRIRFTELLESQRAMWSPHVIANLELANSSLRDIESRRRQIAAMEIAPAEEMAYYTELNERLLDSLGSLVANTVDVSLRATTTAYLYFLYAKERTGLERAQLSNVFGTDRFAPGQLAFVAGLIASQGAFLNIFNKLAPPDVVAFFDKQMSNPAVGEVENMEKIAMAKTTGFGIDSAVWFGTMTKKINLLKSVEDALAAGIRDGSARINDDARRAMAAAFVLAFALLMVAVGATLVLVFKVLRPLQGLRRTVDLVASGDWTVHFPTQGPRELRDLGRSLQHMVEAIKINRMMQSQSGGRSVGSRLSLNR